MKKLLDVSGKNAIVTMASEGEPVEWVRIGSPFLLDYAKRVKADCFIIDDLSNGVHSGHIRLKLRDLLPLYSRVFYVDADTIVSPFCPDLFTLAESDEHFLAFPENTMEDRSKYVRDAVQKLGDANWSSDGCYFNTGLFSCTAKHVSVFRDFSSTDETLLSDMWEQTTLNHRVQASGSPLQYLPLTMNCMTICHKRVKWEDSSIAHFAGVRNRVDEMRKLAAAWKQHAQSS